jgi:hypothetical protein
LNDDIVVTAGTATAFPTGSAINVICRGYE